MAFDSLIDYVNSIFSRMSAWLFAVRNTQHDTGASNYVLITLAICIVITGIIAEWITIDPNRRKAFARWWRRFPWARSFITGYQATATATKDASDVTLPTIARRLIIGREGLTGAQVTEREAAYQVNSSRPRTSRSYRHILFANIFTRFNALLGGLYIIILWVGAPQDSLFGMIIIFNALIGIIQELRAKWTLDRLALVLASQSHVVRNGSAQTIPTNRIVLDDIIELKAGEQAPVDGIITEGTNVEINESLVTGESEPVIKNVGGAVYSGSFVAAGNCRMQAVHIGEHAYARRLANAVREFTLAKSELRMGINKILRYITWVLVPAGFLLFATQLLSMQHGWRDALSSSAGGVVNMVPDGLVLLTSVVMAIAVVRLAKRRVLIQELPSVEMLARVDTLCLDKTGTLTEGAMVVEEIIPFSDPKIKLPAVTRDVLGVFANKQEQTSTLQAIGRMCPYPTRGQWDIRENIPFSSARKWSALTFKRQGTWILGAMDMIVPKASLPQELQLLSDQFSSSGKRVLLLAYSEKTIQHQPGKSTMAIHKPLPVAFIALQEQLRDGVAATLQYFREQGVAIKIISGDNPKTVASVAARAGIITGQPQNGQDLPSDQDRLGELVEEQAVFGRILPEQKKSMVRALHQRGHVVAMVGDGINDVLAIKESDFSIAMGSGTEASRGTAQLVLLDNNFSALPDVIAEGRRIIGNMERTANLFITKAAYIITMALAVGLARTPFPFLPRHLTAIAFFTIGLPSIFLSFMKNTDRARPGFVTRVFRFSLPSGAMIAALTLITFALAREFEPSRIELARTAATLTLFGSGLAMLIFLARPKTIWQKIFYSGLLAGMCYTVGSPALREFFGLVIPSLATWAIILFMIGVCTAGLWQIKKRSAVFEPQIS
ncbi:MAG: HAD-IC family P-type ATPase [Patescibacteria group bacterium]